MGVKVIVTATGSLKLLHLLEMLVFSAACVALPLYSSVQEYKKRLQQFQEKNR